MKSFKYTLPVLLILLFANFNVTQEGISQEQKSLEAEQRWVDSVFNSLSVDEKIGQLMWIRAHSNLGPDHVAKVKRLIKDYHVGGLTFFQGNPEEQARLTNIYQRMTKIPLIISIDAEWGLGMRMKESTISFPRQLMLGAIQDNTLIYDMGKEIARQCRRLGVHFNFAPVADVNNNAANPVINTRSFGEDRINVAAKSYMYMKGMQDHGVLASAKHFPGHGDTDVDSHHDLPVIKHSRERLDSIELFPFQILFDQEVGSVMVAHLQVPAFETKDKVPTTLSKSTATDLLKNEMNFKGLVITDALEMQAVRKHYSNGEVEAMALAAGNDILLLPVDVEAAFKKIKEFLYDGRLKYPALFESVKKSLRYKYRLGLTGIQQVETENLRKDINAPQAYALKRKLIQHSLTLVRDNNRTLPIKKIQDQKIASLSIGAKGKTTFQESLERYKKMPLLQIGKSPSDREKQQIINQLRGQDKVIVSLHNMDSRASRNFGVTQKTIDFLREIEAQFEMVLVVFGNPYSMKFFDSNDCVLLAYEENDMSEDLASQAIFGAFSINGRLPVTASEKSQFGMGVTTQSLFRLGYGLPEEVGLRSDSLARIDVLMEKVIDSLAAPGGVVLVAKNNKVVYHKAFGHQRYVNSPAIRKDDIFDLASVTKVCASTLCMMKLEEDGKISLSHQIQDHLPEFASTNKAEIKIEDMLTHHARLRPWIPFFEETVTSRKKPMQRYYKTKASDQFSIEVTDRLYLKTDYLKTIHDKIAESDLRDERAYVYSDLGLILTGKIIESVSGEQLNHFADKCFYDPLGLETMTYRPLEKHSKTRIPPTDEDRYWRNQRVQGHVHDMAAAMMDGVAGHAGLFANANDLAIVMQMLLNGGYYGGERFLKEETIKKYTSRCDDCTRRGIGFDMKQNDKNYSLNMSEKASDRTFGHLGFTGTCVWTDPEHDLIYVFLSNRTFPKWRGTNKLGEYNFRPRIQEVIYNAME